MATTKELKTKILLRNDTAANWTLHNPKLSKGEIGIESDTGKFKIGDGVNTWSALAYATVLPSELQAEVTRATGVEAGLRTDVDSKVAQSAYDTKITEIEGDISALETNKADKSYVDTELGKKLDKISTANKVYGTDENGAQKAYDVNSFGKVDDVKVDGTSVVTNKIANIDLTGKVDKVSGKSLIDDTKITKLDGISEGANKVEVATEKAGKIKIDGVEKQIMPDNIAIDANYKHITVTSTSVSDGTNTFNKYDDTALAGRVSTIEGDYLKAADKTELEGKITAEETRAKGVEGGLETRIENLEARGRFLSSWNVGTGLPVDYPSIEKGGEYPYKSGDYYIVGSIPESGNKYQPDGNKITRDAAGEYSVPKKAETREIGIGDYYIYTTTGWVWVSNSQKTINFQQIAGAARDNVNLKGELEALESADEALSDRLDAVEGTSHSHSNKALLDTYTQTEANLADAVAKKHAHANKEELDKIASGDKAKWDEAYSKEHDHANKAILDGIAAKNLLTDAQIAEINKVANKADKSYVDDELAKKQDEITSTNKLDADLLKDGTNNKVYTSTEKDKLAGIEAGAEANVLESVSTADGALTISNKGVTIPNALADKFGLAKGNAVENGVEFANGLGTVHSLNVNKLTQTSGDTLVLNGGDASSANA